MVEYLQTGNVKYKFLGKYLGLALKVKYSNSIYLPNTCTNNSNTHGKNIVAARIVIITILKPLQMLPPNSQVLKYCVLGPVAG